MKFLSLIAIGFEYYLISHKYYLLLRNQISKHYSHPISTTNLIAISAEESLLLYMDLKISVVFTCKSKFTFKVLRLHPSLRLFLLS